MSELFKDEKSPFIKWPGGKGSELDIIKTNAPKVEITRFIEPFLGGGSVFLAINSNIERYLNDSCPELIELYSYAASNNKKLQHSLKNLASIWKEFNSLESEFTDFASSSMLKSKKSNLILKKIYDKTELFLLKYEFSEDFIGEFKKKINKDIIKKIGRIYKLQSQKKKDLSLDDFAKNIESSYRSSFYMTVRMRYNSERLLNNYSHIRTADFYFLREFSYASMFRFNSRNEFNVPYGGISYNKKDFLGKVEYLYSEEMNKKLKSAKFFNKDFEFFLDNIKTKSKDFIFVDPPYDSDFSDYDGVDFSSEDQRRLEFKLRNLNSKIMIVIGDTPLIRKIYSNKNWRVIENKLNYKWTIKERNNRNANHLTITNY